MNDADKMRELLREIHEQLTIAVYAGYHTNEGVTRINWCHDKTRAFKAKTKGSK